MNLREVFDEKLNQLAVLLHQGRSQVFFEGVRHFFMILEGTRRRSWKYLTWNPTGRARAFRGAWPLTFSPPPNTPSHCTTRSMKVSLRIRVLPDISVTTHLRMLTAPPLISHSRRRRNRISPLTFLQVSIMVPKITIVDERRTSGASIVSMSSTSSRGRRLDRRGPGPPPPESGADDDSLDLPYPQYKRISLYYFEQTSLPRMISLRMMTSPYPFPVSTQKP